MVRTGQMNSLHPATACGRLWAKYFLLVPVASHLHGARVLWHRAKCMGSMRSCPYPNKLCQFDRFLISDTSTTGLLWAAHYMHPLRLV